MMINKIIPGAIIWLVLFGLGQSSIQATECTADFNQDNVVDTIDIVKLAADFLSTPSNTAYDLFKDNFIDISDLSVLASQIGLDCTTSANDDTANPPPGNDMPLNLKQVDPNSQTDNQINAFLKEQIAAGYPQVLASGSWWGPENQFFHNQMWVINRSFINGNTYSVGEIINQEVACLLPGIDSGLNTLAGTFQMIQQHGYSTDVNSNIVSGEFYTLSHSIRPVTNFLNKEMRTICRAFEGEANNFGDGSAIEGDELQVNINQNILTEGNTRPRNHLGASPHEAIDLHMWYTDIEYAYISLDGGVINGQTVTPNQLVGATVSGDVEVLYYLFKFEHEQDIRFHHTELRIEQNNEDYVVERRYSPPSAAALETGGKQGLTLDTSIVNDGWHILSLHAHVIDKLNPDPKNEKQMAGEIKFAVCVNNSGQADCP